MDWFLSAVAEKNIVAGVAAVLDYGLGGISVQSILIEKDQNL